MACVQGRIMQWFLKTNTQAARWDLMALQSGMLPLAHCDLLVVVLMTNTQAARWDLMALQSGINQACYH